MKIYGNFKDAIKDCVHKLVDTGIEFHPNHWQSQDVSKQKAATMKELLSVGFQVVMPQTIKQLQNDIQPNLPWADDHFQEERISRQPINPGTTWKYWPWSNSADTFRVNGKQFDHSYAERYWGQTTRMSDDTVKSNIGARSRYGDLDDVVNRLCDDPTTRQAVLSVWWPEDQYDYGQRVPCSLTYQFICRGEFFHVIYSIRSCDAFRHFRDDLYLTARLVFWVISELRNKDKSWDNVIPGLFTMQIGSFHCFVNDLPKLKEWIK